MKTFGNYHPAVLFVYFLSVLLVAMFVTNPVLQLCALLGGAFFCATLTARRAWAGDTGFYLLLFLLVTATNPLFSHNGVTPLFFLNGNPVTLEAFAYGAAIAVTVIAVMLWCKSYSAIMTSDKLLYLFGRIIPRLSLVLSMALRFIPLLKRQMHRVSAAQKAMGLYSAKGFVNRLRGAMRVFTAMIAWSFENAMDTAASMRARGYGLKGRTHFSLFRFRRGDGVLLFVCVLLLTVTLVGAAVGVTTFYYYPRLSEPNTAPAAIGVYAAFGVLAFLPFILEVKEALVWKYYVSRT